KSEIHDLPNRSGGKWLESSRDRHLAFTHIGCQHFRCELFFFEFLAEFEVLDVIEKFDDILVRPVAQCAKERRGQKFPTAFAAIEVDVKQISGVELHFDRGTAVRNNAAAVKHFAV